MNFFTRIIENWKQTKLAPASSQKCPWCGYTTNSPSWDMYDSGCCDRCGEYWFEHPDELEKIAEYERLYDELFGSDEYHSIKCNNHPDDDIPF